MQLYKKNDDGEFVEATVFRAFESQEEFDKSIGERLGRVKQQFETKIANEYVSKSDFENAHKKFADLETEKKNLEEQIKGTKLDVARVEIRNEYGLKKEFDKFLIGETEDDIRANAEILKTQGSGGGVVIQKQTEQDAKESPSKALANGIFGPKE